MMRRRDMVGWLVGLVSRVASWLFAGGNRSGRPNIPERASKAATKPRGAFKWVGITIILMRFAVPATGQDPVLSVFGDTFPDVLPNEVIVQTHMYTACVNIAARQPAWVAYRVEQADWDTENKLARNFSTPRRMRRYCLEPSDFTGSEYELGHLYALQFVAACDKGHEVNYLCAVAAQRPGLNKGPWLKAEERIKERSRTGSVAVIAGQLWESEMPRLKNADESHAVASHCWILLTDDTGSEAYLFPQTCKRDDALKKFAVDPAALRARVAPRWIGQRTEEQK